MKYKSIKLSLNWNTLLVVSVILCAFVIPVFPAEWGRFPIRLGFTMIFISGLFSVEKKKWYLLYMSLFCFVLEWVSAVFDWDLIQLISRGMNVVFFLMVIFSLIRAIATSKVVTAQVIMAAISGYLLLGIVYSVLVVAIIQRDPSAFNVIHDRTIIGAPELYLSESMYFGFVTLASLGYGDILPLTPYSRSIATLITISGQLYIAIIISLMVGKYAAAQAEAHHRENRK